MLIIRVSVRVKPGCVDAFRAATIANASKSLEEPGIARFDFIQREDDPTRFELIEAYRDDAAPARHKETAHYAAWRDAVENMMVEPRSSVKLRAVYPPDDGWGMP